MANTPRAKKLAEKTAPVIRTEQERPKKVTTRPQTLGGPKLKLAVAGEIPGMHLFWCNDDGGHIEQLLSEGFDFVEAAEVNMQRATRTNIVADKDIDSRVSKYVGVNEAGQPMRAFLLKCTNETWEEREQEKYNKADRWDGAIRKGRANDIESANQYVPTGYETSLKHNQ